MTTTRWTHSSTRDIRDTSRDAQPSLVTALAGSGTLVNLDRVDEAWQAWNMSRGRLAPGTVFFAHVTDADGYACCGMVKFVRREHTGRRQAGRLLVFENVETGETVTVCFSRRRGAETTSDVPIVECRRQTSSGTWIHERTFAIEFCPVWTAAKHRLHMLGGCHPAVMRFGCFVVPRNTRGIDAEIERMQRRIDDLEHEEGDGVLDLRDVLGQRLAQFRTSRVELLHDIEYWKDITFLRIRASRERRRRDCNTR